MSQPEDSVKGKNMVQLGIFVPKAVAQARMAICKTCEHYNATTSVCSDCHCVMIAKTRLSVSRCPQNKWVAFRLPSKKDIDATKSRLDQ